MPESEENSAGPEEHSVKFELIPKAELHPHPTLSMKNRNSLSSTSPPTTMVERDECSVSTGLSDVNDQQEPISRSKNSQELCIEQKYLRYHREQIDHIDYFRPHDFQGTAMEGLRSLATEHTFVFDAVSAFSALIYSIREAPEARHHADEFYDKALAGLRWL